MNEEIIKKLHSLAQLDRDAVAVYGDVLKDVHEEDVRMHFTEFRDEHAHHITAISEGIVRLGGTAPQMNVDAMGMVAEWVMSFQASLGEKGPLHAMHTAEQYHNSRYKEAAAWAVEDTQLAAEIKVFYGEEQRHLSYVEERLSVKA